MSDQPKTYIEHFLSDEQGRQAYVAGSLIADVHWLLGAAFEGSKMTYVDLGNAMGVSKARAHQVITGEGNLTLDLMSRAAAAFGFAWRLGLDDIKTRMPVYTLESLYGKGAIEWFAITTEVTCDAVRAANGSYAEAA